MPRARIASVNARMHQFAGFDRGELPGRCRLHRKLRILANL
jgi:hypothetical protein